MKKGNITKILDYYMLPDNALMFFERDIKRAFNDFFEDKTDISPSMEAVGHFNEWFLYDFRLSTGETPLKYFYDKNPLRLPPEELEGYKDMQDNVYDIFEVEEVRKEKGLSLIAVRSGDKYEVQEKFATSDLRKGDIFVCRVIKTGDHYELAGGSSVVLSQEGKTKKETKKFLADTADEINPKIIFHAFAEKTPGVNFTESNIADSGATLVSGNFDGAPMQEDDNCAVCRLTRKAREEGREPTADEIKRAMKEVDNEKK